jgi:hypothetical protein
VASEILIKIRVAWQIFAVIEKTHSHAVYIQETTQDIYGIAGTTRAVITVLVYLFE